MTLSFKERLIYTIRLPLLFIVFLWQDVYCYFKRKKTDPSIRLDGKLALVTGANRGIGQQIAADLYERGAQVILACRDYSSALKACVEIANGQENDPRLVPIKLDCGSFKSIRESCVHLLSTYNQLDILINNAGMVGSKVKTFTADGYEETCQVNFLAPCLLTYHLMPLLSKSTFGARVVMVTSEFNLLPIGFNSDLFVQSSQAYNGLINYSMSKFALNGAVIKLIDQYKDKTNVTINCVHPGCVKTDIVGQGSSWVTRLSNRGQQMFRGISIKTGAQGPLYVAIDPSLTTTNGQYFIGGHKFNQNKRLSDEKMINTIWNFLEPCLIPLDPNHNN
ncbi:retinol dehydrogenase 14-like [Panonychus citri]|uniref:retinol dehydrogenase 14-like n=1 Tax=Panonychus citri TaxID=50023 RepID=UPI0023075441|nr:retinol dehydrogenase 14-like [Panonychus citri]